jgi:hypothetical protein
MKNLSRLATIAVVLSLACAGALAQMPARSALPALEMPASFRAPLVAPLNVVSLPAPQQKALVAPPSKIGPVRVGDVRELPKAVRVAAWTAVAGGYVTRFRATSDQALGLRVRLDLGAVPGSMEVRVQGDGDRIETMVLDPTLGPAAWTPWTEGPTQVIELFSPVKPGNDDAVRVGAVLHFDKSIVQPKAAGACTLETMCAATDTSLPPGVADAIAERKKSVARIGFVSGSQAFVCTGTLINTEKFPAPYFLTANHCISTDDEARSITAFFFYESDAACPDQGQPPFRSQVSGGMQLVFTNFNVDSTLLLLNGSPPTGTVYAGWDPTHLTNSAPVVSISNPEGDTMRYAIGFLDQEFRVNDWPQDMYGIRFSHGIIQEGSSGSGLFTMASGSLVLRGILTGTTVTNNDGGLSCTNLSEDGLYSRFEIFEPEIVPYITVAGKPADDAPNRAIDLFTAPADPTQADVLTQHLGTVRSLAKNIDYQGDLDVYRIILNGPALLSTWTEGSMDTVGTLLDANGEEVDVNDDAQVDTTSLGNNFGLSKQLDSGTYYLQVAPWDPTVTGPYTLKMRADVQDTNYTDLWWAAPAGAESGWGINLNHQGSVIFATLFDYDTDGSPMWLVMSDGERQSDGSYFGMLYRTTGPVFNAQPFNPTAVVVTSVGQMRISFSGASAATLTYSINNTQVTKQITRQVFSTAPTCGWSAFDRSFATNFQDLWWNPAESGWGVNLTHQGDILFATLFTYDASGKGLWLVMSDGVKTSDAHYSGKLYSTHGPSFDAVPFSPSAVTITEVGTMSFAFTNGNAGTMTYTYNGTTVTKSIQRQVFRDIKTQCES